MFGVACDLIILNPPDPRNGEPNGNGRGTPLVYAIERRYGRRGSAQRGRGKGEMREERCAEMKMAPIARGQSLTSKLRGDYFFFFGAAFFFAGALAFFVAFFID
jgi:hypothetical protein